MPRHLPADGAADPPALDDLGHDVPVIAVSVDPANDTAQRAKTFSLKQGLTGRMRWVLGTSAQLQRIWRAYGVAPQTLDRRAFGVDGPARRERAPARRLATSRLTPEGLAHDLAALERAPPAS